MTVRDIRFPQGSAGARRAVPAVSTPDAHKYEAKRSLGCRTRAPCHAPRVANPLPFERGNVVCSSGLQAAFNAVCTSSGSCRKRSPQANAVCTPGAHKYEARRPLARRTRVTCEAPRVATRAVPVVGIPGADEYEARRPRACRTRAPCHAPRVATRAVPVVGMPDADEYEARRPRACRTHAPCHAPRVATRRKLTLRAAVTIVVTDM